MSLTTRQWELYNYLKLQDGWKTQFSIVIELSSIYNVTGDDLVRFHDCKARMDMTNDIRAINKSDVIQKMIIVSSRGVKIASEEEAARFIKAQYAAIFRRLARARKLERKAGLDGQFKIVFGQEREIVQAFTDSNEVGEHWKEARKEAGYTQKQAAAALRKYTPFDEPTLSKIENGVFLPTADQSAAFEKVYS